MCDLFENGYVWSYTHVLQVLRNNIIVFWVLWKEAKKKEDRTPYLHYRPRDRR